MSFNLEYGYFIPGIKISEMFHKRTSRALDKVDCFISIIVWDFQEQFIRSDKRRADADDNSTRHWFNDVIPIHRLTCHRFESRSRKVCLHCFLKTENFLSFIHWIYKTKLNWKRVCKIHQQIWQSSKQGHHNIFVCHFE